MTHKILYIEDDAANLQLVELIFDQREDISLITATTGGEGLEKAKENKPDIILLDLSLPDMHGIEVLQLLKTDDSLKEIPVVALSGDLVTTKIPSDKTTGFFATIPKPVDINLFFDTIEKALKIK